MSVQYVCMLRSTSWRAFFSAHPQYSGKFYEEIPNTADYVSYRLACNKEDYPEPFSPPISPPLSFLPQHAYNSSHATTGPTSPNATSTLPKSKNTFLPTTTTAIFKYPSIQGLSSPPPGVAPYTFPKEQYVWIEMLPSSEPLKYNYKLSPYR